MTASVHYSDDAVTLWHGDARQVSEFIPANSVNIATPKAPTIDGQMSFLDDAA
jgi:hypothetical protein